MSNIFLKIFSIDTLIEFVVVYLTSTVKNPSSSKALQIRRVVHRLYKAAKRFLEETGGLPVEL